MDKEQRVEIKIEDISSEGSGIGKYEGMAVFVHGTAPGDTVICEATKVKKNYALAKLIEIKEPAVSRIEPDCKYFEKGICGGCSFRNISYEAELAIKEKQVRDKIVRLAGIENPVIRPIAAAENTDRYRNKAQFQIGGDSKEPKIGFYSKKSHNVANIYDCMLQNDLAMAAARALSDFMCEEKISVYDENTEKGLMRHLIVKTAVSTAEVMVILVMNGKDIPNPQKLVEMLDDSIYNAGGNLESVVINVNRKNTSQITGDEYITLAGKPTILSTCMGLQFEISPAAFYQVNPEQTEVLYSKAIEYAELTGTETVFDLYCGVGTIGLLAADKMRKLTIENCGFVDYEKMGRVYGIESVKGAVVDASRNAVINGIVNAEFICGKAEEKINDLLNGYTDRDGFEIKGKNPDVVIIDPPRNGCDASLIEIIIEVEPERIVYVSCDAATMARDIKLLSDKYELAEAMPVDMFPRCNNVETVCKLVKRDK